MSILMKLAASVIIFLFCYGCEKKAGNSPQEAMRKISQAAGVDGFEKVESMSFIFNAKIGDKNVVRSWTWMPKTDEVTLRGETGAEDVSYKRSEISSDETDKLTTIDQQFVNDLYWLIFPLQVVWDSSVTVEALPEDAAAVVPEASSGLRVRYPEGVGYTPGDVYDLFYDENFQVTHWVFRKGGSAEPSRITAWEDYKEFGPLSISLNRPSPDGDFRIWFENVSVETAE